MPELPHLDVFFENCLTEKLVYLFATSTSLCKNYHKRVARYPCKVFNT